MHEQLELERLSARLVSWRSTNKAPKPLPDDVWSGAASLASSLGVGKVASALRLDRASLAKRVKEQPCGRSEKTTFVEWTSSFVSNLGECAVDIQSASGAKLRLEFRDVPTHSLAALVRELMA
jgi:hypothetical protein